jgi:DNA modification methylase
MFTGVSGQAAMRMGRRYIGVEIDKKLFGQARTRIAGARE